jgi:Fe-S cluster assembly protein SufD
MAIQVSNSETATQPTKREQREAYLKSLLSTAQANVPDTLAFADLRAKAEAIVNEHTFPSNRDEDWRFTDLSPMLAVPFQAAESPAEIDMGALGPVQMPEAIARIVLVNGQYNATLSDIDHFLRALSWAISPILKMARWATSSPLVWPCPTVAMKYLLL